MAETLRLPFAHARQPLARHHSVEAARHAAHARAEKSARYLDLVLAAGDDGITDWETVAATGWPLSSVCSIRNGCAVFLWPASRVAHSPYGRAVTAWRRATEAEVASTRQAQAQQAALEDVR